MIRILVADYEQEIREDSAKIIADCVPDADITVCASAEEAIDAAAEGPFDVAFLGIEMPGMNGLELAKRLRKGAPATNIIFSADNPQHAADAFGLHASGYITKPLTKDKIMAEMSDLRYPVVTEEKGLRIRAFGNFEVFCDGKPLHFRYAKTKELLAYLVDRNGAVVDIGEIRATLWDDDEDRTSYIKQIRKDLVDSFREVGKEDAIVVMRGGMGVAPAKLRCDYFDYLAGDARGINSYHGEYMQQYSWSEMTHGSLESRRQ